MHATIDAVLSRTELAPDLPAADHDLALRIAMEMTRYGISALPRDLFEGPSGRRIARIACEDVEGVRRMAECFAPRETTVHVEEKVEEPATEEGAEPLKKTVVREETRTIPPRVVEFSEGRGMISLVLGRLWPGQVFHVVDADERRRWLWQRMLLSFGVRNVRFLPAHARLAPGEWDVVLVKNAAPPRAMDLAGALLAEGGQLLLWQNRQDAKGLRRRHLDARSRPLRLAGAVALASPAAAGRLVARVESPLDGLDGPGDEA